MEEILANQHQANKSANDLMRLPAGGHALTGPCAAANANRRSSADLRAGRKLAIHNQFNFSPMDWTNDFKGPIAYLSSEHMANRLSHP
jgi:hypothetical protein